MNEKDVIEAFVAHLRKSGCPGLRVDRWPDEEIRNTPEIDAIAGHFAIEHTSIDTLPNQRQWSDWFARAVGRIEKEVSLPFRLEITIEYDAVIQGQHWESIRKHLEDWIIDESPRLPDGQQVVEGVEGVPFPLHVRKASSQRPGISIARFQPNDDTLPTRIRKQLDRKAKKLARYRNQGKTTVLLIESDDIALMNEGVMLDSIQEAYPSGLPNGVDGIWYAGTTIPDDIEFVDFTSEIVRGVT